jgi:hypothetical protein
MTITDDNGTERSIKAMVQTYRGLMVDSHSDANPSGSWEADEKYGDDCVADLDIKSMTFEDWKNLIGDSVYFA